MNKLVAIMMVLFVGALQAVEITNNSNQKITIRLEAIGRTNYSEKLDIEPKGTASASWTSNTRTALSKIIIETEGNVGIRKELVYKGPLNPKKIILEKPKGSWELKSE